MDPRLPPVLATPAPSVRTAAPAPSGAGAESVSGPGKSVPQDPGLDAERAAPAPPQRLTTEVRIEMDRAAGRMVQTFIDPTTGETLRQFPYESQLAFARALQAFERARLKQD